MYTYSVCVCVCFEYLYAINNNHIRNFQILPVM